MRTWHIKSHNIMLSADGANTNSLHPDYDSFYIRLFRWLYEACQKFTIDHLINDVPRFKKKIHIFCIYR